MRRRATFSVAVLTLAIAGAVVLLLRGGNSHAVTGPALLPMRQTYSALLATEKPETLLLGTGDGAFISTDGGRTWRRDGLEGMLVMNLAAAGGNVVWAAGHELLARSEDGGESWHNVSPPGLPQLDVHGFAIDPRDSNRLWAGLAAIGAGLYRSTDGGRHFSYVSATGSAPLALTVTAGGAIIDAQGRLKLIQSTDEAKSWKPILDSRVTDVAADPEDPQRILVSTKLGVLFLTTNDGKSWKKVLAPQRGYLIGIGPISWSHTTPRLAFAADRNGRLYRSVDAGVNWNLVRG